MNKDVLRFFSEWHNTFKLSHAFCVKKSKTEELLFGSILILF